MIVDALAGIGTHLYCRRHEPENYWKLLGFLGSVPLFPAYLLGPHYNSLLYCYAISATVFLSSLLISIVSYRLSPLHPLAGHRGPILWRVTKFSAAYYGSFGKYHIKLKQLHDEYGPIVRIGPNELSIIQADMIPHILGTHGMPKGPLWEGRRILSSPNFNINNHMIGVRDLKRHAELRKPWNKAFGTEPMKDYEETLLTRVSILENCLQEICDAGEGGVAQVDVKAWASFFAFDFMGDVAWSDDFSLCKEGDIHGYVKNLEDAQSLPTIVQHVPWLAKVARATPYIGAGMRAFGGFAMAQAKRRAAKTVVTKDLFYHLLQAIDPEFKSNPLPFLMANAILVVLAGSDTTSSALTSAFFYLLTNPECYKRLQKEIDDATAELGNTPSPEQLTHLPYLNAVINETLRIQPPVPTSVQRAPMVGSGGKMLGSMFLPEGTNVQVPPYVLHRNPRYFHPNPESFWPERWLQHSSSSESDSGSASDTSDKKQSGNVILEKGAFIPFSVGPAQCAGKPLAMMELRVVLAMWMSKFEIKLKDGFDKEAWVDALTDRLTLFRDPVLVDIKRRSV